MAKNTITNEKAIEVAMSLARLASQTKDWRLRDKRSRAFKALAIEFVKNGKGYIIATAQELAEKHPNLFDYDGPDDDKKYIWAIHPYYRGNYVKFSFGAIK